MTVIKHDDGTHTLWEFDRNAVVLFVVAGGPSSVQDTPCGERTGSHCEHA